MTDPEVRVDPIHLREHESRGRESPRKTSMSSGADDRRLRIEECLRNTPHGAERLDRRNEVINEALADEVRRGEQRKNRSDGTTVAAPGTEPAAASATTAAAGRSNRPNNKPRSRPSKRKPDWTRCESKEETTYEVNTVDSQQQ